MKFTIGSIVIALALIIGAVIISGDKSENPGSGNNVSTVNGVQVIDLRARGGYNPKKSTAKAGIPTVLKVNTSGTFDCSSAIRIPSMDISRNLPSSGTTEIDLGNPQVGVLQGMCSMGMYFFEINFES